MTSVLKRYSQIDARIRYFTVFGGAETTVNTYTLASGATTGVVDYEDVRAGASLSVPSSNTLLLKDLGRTIYVYDSSVNTQDEPVGPQVAILRQVQRVAGPTTGGVSGSAADNFKSYWIATWVSTGDVYPVAAPVPPLVQIVLAPVARTG